MEPEYQPIKQQCENCKENLLQAEVLWVEGKKMCKDCVDKTVPGGGIMPLEPKTLKRIYHTWDKWECYPAGFYEGQKEGMEDEQCKESYRDFLSDLPRLGRAIVRVMSEWKNSCEHYLTNESMNRVAWLGQASACIDMGMPSRYRSGYFLLTDEQQKAADALALEHLNKWIVEHGGDPVDSDGAGVSAKVNLY